MTIAVFSYTAWAARYPELAATVDECLAEELFAEAGIYLDNTDCSPVPCDPTTYQPRRALLGMVVAHLAALGAAGRSGIVGRVSNATQGSVSVTVEYNAGNAAAWFLQTPYGANYWQATAAYRTMHYVPGPPPANSFNSVWPFAPQGGYTWRQ